MCRMIASAGQVPRHGLIHDFVEMSHNRGERHELNATKEFTHGSGWGAVYKSHDGAWAYKRSVSPVWGESETMRRYMLAETEAPIVHARRASVGDVKLENTHPFCKQHDGRDWFFCHNGTVKAGLPEYAGMEGESDSERLFMYLLEHFDDKRDVASIADAVRSLDGCDYSALNSFLFNGSHVYAINRHTKWPAYYTMKTTADDGMVVVSSEVLPSLSAEWNQMENGQIAKIDVDKATIELS